MTSGTPCPRASDANFVTRKLTATAPMIGTKITKGPRARRREHIRVVAKRELPEKQKVVDKADQVAEQHRTQPGHNSDQKC
jgi:hypothetical protein